MFDHKFNLYKQPKIQPKLQPKIQPKIQQKIQQKPLKLKQYNSIINNSIFNKNISFQFNKKINNTFMTFNSSSATIIRYQDNSFIINVRIVNYKLDELGRSNIGNNTCVTINKCYIIDDIYNESSIKYMYPTNYNVKCVGIEDIRLFNFKDKIYFIGSLYNEINDKIEIVSNEYNLEQQYNPIIIKPSFKTEYNWEKNWVFFNNNNELNVIYKWYPIYICKIDYAKKQLNLIREIKTVPNFFKNVRGSTNGVEYNNKIWFIVHKQDFLKNYKNDHLISYVHIFVVFDKNMNLFGFSKQLKFENTIVEYCIGMEVYNDNFIIIYSTSDSSTKLSIFPVDYINSLIVNLQTF